MGERGGGRGEREKESVPAIFMLFLVKLETKLTSLEISPPEKGYIAHKVYARRIAMWSSLAE